MYDCLMLMQPACPCQACGAHVELLQVHVQQRQNPGRPHYWHLVCWLSRGPSQPRYTEGASYGNP